MNSLNVSASKGDMTDLSVLDKTADDGEISSQRGRIQA